MPAVSSGTSGDGVETGVRSAATTLSTIMSTVSRVLADTQRRYVAVNPTTAVSTAMSTDQHLTDPVRHSDIYSSTLGGNSAALGSSSQGFFSDKTSLSPSPAAVSVASSEISVIGTLDFSTIANSFAASFTNSTSSASAAHRDQTEHIIGLSVTPSTIGGLLPTTMPIEWSASLVCVAIVLCLIVVLTVGGNALVLVSFVLFSELRSTTNTLIISLSLTDLILGLCVLPFSTVGELTNGQWYFGKYMCYIWICSDVCLCTASILNLFAISVDRHICIMSPLAYRSKVTRKRVYAAITMVWVVSIVASWIPIVQEWHITSTDSDPTFGITKCTFISTNIIYTSFVGIGTFFIPLTIMLGVYLRILRAARWQAKEINAQVRSNFVQPRNGHNTTALLQQPNAPRSPKSRVKLKLRHGSTRQDKNMANEHKATVTVFVILGFFIVCWLPYFVVFTFSPIWDLEINKYVFSFFLWTGYANSSINPFLYGFLNRDFREAFLKIWLRIRHCSKDVYRQRANSKCRDFQGSCYYSTSGAKLPHVDTSSI